MSRVNLVLVFDSLELCVSLLASTADASRVLWFAALLFASFFFFAFVVCRCDGGYERTAGWRLGGKISVCLSAFVSSFFSLFRCLQHHVASVASVAAGAIAAVAAVAAAQATILNPFIAIVYTDIYIRIFPTGFFVQGRLYIRNKVKNIVYYVSIHFPLENDHNVLQSKRFNAP